ncbi:hypothetical protein ABTM42_19790, partial [Acinetobacter baumannii]
DKGSKVILHMLYAKLSSKLYRGLGRLKHYKNFFMDAMECVVEINRVFFYIQSLSLDQEENSFAALINTQRGVRKPSIKRGKLEKIKDALKVL